MADDKRLVDVMLTTVDNPYDPFEQYDLWESFDQENGYNTPSVLAQYADVSNSMTDSEQLYEISNAIDEILQDDLLLIYKKVEKYE